MYYIAILAPPAIDEEVTRWKHFMRDRFGCIVALKSPAHITLVSPFWMDLTLQSNLEVTLEGFGNPLKPFQIELHNFDCFKPRVIFVNVRISRDLLSLYGAIQVHFKNQDQIRIKDQGKEFHPHITIANRDLRKTDFEEAWQYFKTKTFQAAFLAKGITLMKHNGTSWDPAYTAALMG